MEGKDLIVSEYLQGTSVQTLAKKYGVTREAIYLRLRTLPNWREISKQKNREKKKDKLQKQREEVFKLAQEGKSVSTIRKELGLAHKTVSDIVKGSQYDRRRETLRDRNSEIRRLRGKGWDRQRLCDKYGIKQRQLDNILSK